MFLQVQLGCSRATQTRHPGEPQVDLQGETDNDTGTETESSETDDVRERERLERWDDMG